MAKTLSIAELEAHVTDCIQAAEEGDTVVVTRNGRPVVALVRAVDAGKRLPCPKGAQGLASLAGGWEGSDELVERIAEHRRSRPREARTAD